MVKFDKQSLSIWSWQEMWGGPWYYNEVLIVYWMFNPNQTPMQSRTKKTCFYYIVYTINMSMAHKNVIDKNIIRIHDILKIYYNICT